MWMVGRAINFDFTNYNKFYSNPDKGTKNRYLKNFMRFVDSPINYVFWHTLPYWQTGKFKFLIAWWMVTYGGVFLISGRLRTQASAMDAGESTYQGHTQWEFPVETYSQSKMMTFYFHDHEYNGDKGKISQKAALPNQKFCRLNNYVRDQNFRKYFAHRERREVDPFTGAPKK
mmetsp:Transcript_30983/g.30639  ORF Transcript_30983/g.30639 Transcript_30983/m.30639 type:complete len:173 (+) Transcript_30983:114-632(+)